MSPPSPERSRSGAFWRPTWRRLPAAEREQLVLPAAGPAGSVISRGPEPGREDQQLQFHIVRRDTGITGKAASTEPAAICKDAGDVLEDRVLGRVVFARAARFGFGSGDRRCIAELAGLLAEQGGRLDEGLRLG